MLMAYFNSQPCLFSFSYGFYAFGADFLGNPVNFFGLKIDSEFSKGFDIGVADFISSFGTSAADIANSRHKVTKYESNTKYENTNNNLFRTFAYFVVRK